MAMRGMTRRAGGSARHPGGPVVEHPFIYEINTWVWLDDLGRRLGRPIGLADVPRGRVGRDRAARLRRRLADGRLGAEPGGGRDRAAQRRPPAGASSGRSRTARRTTSSARRTASRDYTVARHLGGPAGLAAAREALAGRGAAAAARLRAEPRRARPSVDGSAPRVLRAGRPRRTSQRDPAAFIEVGGRVLANGRDPYFPAWPDVVQLERVLARAAARRDRHRRGRSPTSATACGATWRC